MRLLDDFNENQVGNKLRNDQDKFIMGNDTSAKTKAKIEEMNQ